MNINLVLSIILQDIDYYSEKDIQLLIEQNYIRIERDI